ncbi:MAG: maltose alpha-D-glucosyltransferase [Leeuwenhoekiella sp.]
MSHTPTAATNTRWYKDAIIYELHIKAFFDSDGDGIGDFEGLMQKLDYIEDLGVTAIWLLPFYPSPLRDDGYDISDYYTINPSYGNIKGFKKLIKEAHKRNLKIITELVINHTSDQHEWFQKARNAPKDSPERNYYVWTDDPTKYKDARIIFTDTEPSNWSWDPVAKQYFWHRFFSHQPDLNFDNPEVQEEVFKIMDFWCNLGVDGFRLDAVPYLFEREDTNCENLPPTHEFLKKLRAHVDANFDDKLLLAEANMWPEDSAAYFGDGDECHMNYHFPIMPRMFMAVKMEDRYPIIDIIDQTPEIPESCQWAIFLRNHDELTLEMVTDEERDYMYKVYTKDPQAKINVGIRHRLAPLLDNNRNKIELMNVLLFSLPGTPVLYYGDEIGMGDNFYLGDRDGVRTPMQWSPDRNAGFSNANPQRLYLPTIIDPEYKYESVNVESQQMNSSSLLWWNRRVISMRKKYKAFGRGTIEFLAPDNAKILAFTRSFEDETILVVANLSRFSQAAEIDLSAYAGSTPVEVFSHNNFPRIAENDYLFTMSPHGYLWLSLVPDHHSAATGKLPTVAINNWSTFVESKGRKILDLALLKNYLKPQTWFEGHEKTIQDMGISQAKELEVSGFKTAITIVEVNYNEGLPELYQLPIAFVSKNQEELINDLPEKAIIANATLGKKTGILVDAVYLEAFRKSLFNFIKKEKSINHDNHELKFYKGKVGIEAESKAESSKLMESADSNSSIIYENRYFLKLYRRLDSTINPDLEISQYLSEQVDFPNVSQFVGGISFHISNRHVVALGMMEYLVPNHGKGWEYANDVLHRFFENVLSRDKELDTKYHLNHITNPLPYSEFPESLQGLMGSIFPERLALLGQRSAEMHYALSTNLGGKDFGKEDFSLHYQRSVFSSLQSLTRSTFSKLAKKITSLPEHVQPEAKQLLKRKDEVLQFFKRIFDHKINTTKIRTHGDFHLNQVLWTGKDFIMSNFEGEPERPFSERRLKRSPLRDIAAMIRSLHYAAYSSVLEQEFDSYRKDAAIEEWAETWYVHATKIFLHHYFENSKNADFIPDTEADTSLLLQVFILEKAVYELNFELSHRLEWAEIPMRGIISILEDAE